MTADHNAIIAKHFGSDPVAACKAQDMLTEILASQSPAEGDATRRGLLPCPFCGSRPVLTVRPDNAEATSYFAAVACFCGGYAACAHKDATASEADEAERLAREKWNGRAAHPQPKGTATDWTDEQINAAWGRYDQGYDTRRALIGRILAAAQSPAPAHDADGEAFRTAARLGLTLRFDGGVAQSASPGTPSAYEVVSGQDRAAAMRQAVSQATAVIAAGGESHNDSMAKLRAPAVQDGWQPIETAPKDGRKLILAYRNRNDKARTVMARWVTDDEAAETDADGVGLEGGWYECIDNWDEYSQVTIQEGEPSHWMPLPAAPGFDVPVQGSGS